VAKSKFAKAKAGRGATNIGASFDVSALTPELPRGFYDDGVRIQPYEDNQRCVHVRKLASSRTKFVMQRCGQIRLVGEHCFYHCSAEERVAYRAARDARKG
jgi:hypothetical protein